MAEKPGAERFRHLPPAPDPESLRAEQEGTPRPEEWDDGWRESMWVVARSG